MLFYKESKHKSKTCQFFNIARITLDAWILYEQQMGQLKQPKSLNTECPSKILDLQAFEGVYKNNTVYSGEKSYPFVQTTTTLAIRSFWKSLIRWARRVKKRIFPIHKPERSCTVFE